MFAESMCQFDLLTFLGPAMSMATATCCKRLAVLSRNLVSTTYQVHRRRLAATSSSAHLEGKLVAPTPSEKSVTFSLGFNLQGLSQGFLHLVEQHPPLVTPPKSLRLQKRWWSSHQGFSNVPGGGCWTPMIWTLM